MPGVTNIEGVKDHLQFFTEWLRALEVMPKPPHDDFPNEEFEDWLLGLAENPPGL